MEPWRGAKSPPPAAAPPNPGFTSPPPGWGQGLSLKAALAPPRHRAYAASSQKPDIRNFAMDSRWNASEAKEFAARYAGKGVNEDLAVRTYTTRLLGSDPRMVLHGGGNTSVKTTVKDQLGE